MTAPTVLQKAGYSSGTGDSGSIPFAPAPYTAGSILVFAIAFGGNSYRSVTGTPSGATVIPAATTASSVGPFLTLYWMPSAGASSTPTFTLSDTASSCAGVMVEIANANTTSPVDGASLAYFASAGAVTPPGLVPDVAGCLPLVVGTYGYVHPISSNTSGWILDLSEEPTYSSCAVAHGPATSDTTTAIAGTLSASGHNNASVAGLLIKPATHTITPPTVAVSVPAYTTYRDTASLVCTATAGSGAISTYAWTVTTAPSGSTATIGSASSATASFTPDKEGTYTLTCTVTDADTGTASASATTTCRAAVYVNVSGTAKPAAFSVKP